MNKVENSSPPTRKARASRRVPLATRRPPAKPKLDPAPLAEWVRKIRELPDVRKDLVARVKAEIAAGTYETPEKLDAAIERLLEDLREA